MAGHSRWANIKRKKGVNDQKKASVFTKLSRNITISVIEGGGVSSPENNIRLRIAIEKARAANMPGDTIKRAIEKGEGADKNLLQQVVYEAFGPHGSTFIIPTATDNTNRSIAEIRLIVERNGGKLASPGAVNYLFSRMGVIRVPLSIGMENILDYASSINAEDIIEGESEVEVYFPYDQLGKIEDSTAEEVYKQLIPVTLDSREQEEDVIRLMEMIDDHDDVQQVFSNIDFRHI